MTPAEHVATLSLATARRLVNRAFGPRAESDCASVGVVGAWRETGVRQLGAGRFVVGYENPETSEYRPYVGGPGDVCRTVEEVRAFAARDLEVRSESDTPRCDAA